MVKSLRSEEKYVFNRSMEPHPDQLHLAEASEFLPRISKWTSIGGGVLVTTFVAAISLAGVFSYKVTVKVPATIRPTGELKVVQAGIEGTVQHIAVKENQVVSQGEAIAQLDNSRLQIQKSQLEDSIQKNQLQLNQVDAQMRDMEAQISAEQTLMNRTMISAKADLGGIERNYQDQQIKTQADMKQAEAALSYAKEQLERLQRENLLKATVEEAEAALKVAQVQRDRFKHEKLLKTSVQQAEAALRLAEVQRDRLQPIVESGAVSRNQYEEKEQEVKAAEAQLEQAKVIAKNEIEDREQAVKVAEAKLAQAQASAKNQLQEKQQAVDIAELNLKKVASAVNPSDAPVTVASERIKQEQAKSQGTLATLNKERENQVQNHLEIQKQLERDRKQLQQIEEDLQRTIVRAPLAGVLLQLQLRNPGQVIQPSEPIAQIAPLEAPLLIKAQVAAQDIDKVKQGQKVQMQVSACPYPDYGTLKGTVKSVAPDALPSAKNNPATSMMQSGYEVIIEPQTPYVGSSTHQCSLKAGMEGRADIISREETVLKFILRKIRLLADFN